jgi:FlaA1/EpsC-like NDP-sugar epimerase
MNNILEILGRVSPLFAEDVGLFDAKITNIVSKSSFLVLGGAGSIGQAVSKEIFKRNPKKLYVVDISENNLVEFVRDVRSSLGYIDGDFRTFALDIGSWQFDAFLEINSTFDFVLNLTALKHVRSEKDPFTLARLVETNIINTVSTVTWAKNKGIKKYFAVSTDKAANPINMMGASKRIMELFLMRESKQITISTARFANVAFSDGSLLHGFEQRLIKRQPIVAPDDVKRYFVTAEESGLICLFSAILGENGDIFFPKLSERHLQKFSDIAMRYLTLKGFEPMLVKSENEAREFFKTNKNSRRWPCLFTASDTTGEKDFEEFYTSNEILDLNTYNDFGIVKSNLEFNNSKLDNFIEKFNELKKNRIVDKEIMISMFKDVLPDFEHEEKGKYLDSKM